MTAHLNLRLAHQHAAERERAAEQTRLASELPGVTGFTLRGHHLAKLDRFLGQAQRAAQQAERQFGGVTIEITPRGVVTLHAVGMTSVRL